jgi:hypothetical protein
MNLVFFFLFLSLLSSFPKSGKEYKESGGQGHEGYLRVQFGYRRA